MNMPTQSYLPKLDGLRGVSIGLVLLEHFLISGYALGGIGVTVFFVISGYLITSILISYADAFSIKDAAAKFYWRRTLRLFPVYYFCIAAAFLLNIGGMRETWWVNALYLMNFKVAWSGSWNGSSHFWSLCVEEQFYLLWFVVVVVLPRRFLLPAIGLSIAIAPLFRGLMYALGANHLVFVLLPGSMDSLATGALISYAVCFGAAKEPWRIFLKARTALLLLSLCLIVAMQILNNELLTGVFSRCLVNIFAACLVTLSIEKSSDWRWDWLGGKAITHLGKISYGIYVYHYFVPQVMDAHLHLDWIQDRVAADIVRFVVLAATSVAIAEVSWRLIEKPILRLKDRVLFVESRKTIALQSKS